MGVLTDEERKNLMSQIAENSAALSCRSALLTKSQVSILLGIKGGSLDALTKAPGFPRPVRLSVTAHPRWKCGEICDWIEARRRLF